MIKRNPNLAFLQPTYLFESIAKRLKEKQNLVNLSIGDTSEPISTSIVDALKNYATDLGTPLGYQGYGPAFGMQALREKIATLFYSNLATADEIFISDGAKCDLGRLHLLFDSETSIAIQDPTFPVYRDTSLMMGRSKIFTMPCNPQNGFFPTKEQLPNADLIYICSPNNPTGSVATHAQLKQIVEFAKENHSIIIFDAAYSGFIQDPNLPRSIYEIPGAHEVAIEVHSLSKLAGFTGIRLGWTVVPKALGQLHADWQRIVSTFFNGASCLAQQAGLAVEPEEIQRTIQIYLTNAKRLKEAFAPFAKNIYGGEHAPYLWMEFEEPMWKFFFDKLGIVLVPGEGFGDYGKNYLRASSFANQETIQETINRCTQFLSPSLT